MSIPVVSFLCVHNAGRSQMAAALMAQLADGAIEVRTGGSEPADAVNSAAVSALAEVGIDISGHRPKKWDVATLRESDVIVTMGCGESCPVLPGRRYVDWDVPDPAGEPLDRVREIRDRINELVSDLLAEILHPEDGTLSGDE